MYATPETDDGWVTALRGRDGDALVVDARFALPAPFRSLVRGPGIRAAVRGAQPSGAARYQHHAPRTSPGSTAATAICGSPWLPPSAPTAWPSTWTAWSTPGLRVGRLVFCPKASRLGSTEIHDLIRDNQMQVPAGFSLNANGYLILRPQQQIFRFSHQLTPQEVTAIVNHADGKDLLNRLQIRERVDNIELAPNDGLVTACTMFLHRHYVVLQNLDDSLGFHLQATVLDPVSTRGTNIYLEFINRSDQLIVNPTVAAIGPRGHAPHPGAPLLARRPGRLGGTTEPTTATA